MIKWGRYAAVCLSLAAAAGAAIAAPEYAPVPAQMVRERDGLGNVLTKLKAGKEVNIAYFGGSITAMNGWRNKTMQWFRETYPNAKVNEIHAAIGGTGSDLGVYRFGQDVMKYKPDLIFVEFSVNDGGAQPENIWRGMEGIIRQAWKVDPTIDICYVYTFRNGIEKELIAGVNPKSISADEMLADYYGISSINMALRTAELVRDGKMWIVPEKDAEGKDKPTPEGVILFSTDGVHPADGGHQVYADVINPAIAKMAQSAKPGAHALKAPFIADNWEAAKMVPITPAMLTGTWEKLPTDSGLGKNFANRMPELWHTKTPGSKLTFRFKGSAAKLYSLYGPDGGMLNITVDGKTREKPQPLFDHYCTYHRLVTVGFVENQPIAEHTVTVELRDDQPDRSPASNKEKDKPGFNPAKYDGTNLWGGSILLIGDLVP